MQKSNEQSTNQTKYHASVTHTKSVFKIVTRLGKKNCIKPVELYCVCFAEYEIKATEPCCTTSYNKGEAVV